MNVSLLDNSAQDLNSWSLSFLLILITSLSSIWIDNFENVEKGFKEDFIDWTPLSDIINEKQNHLSPWLHIWVRWYDRRLSIYFTKKQPPYTVNLQESTHAEVWVFSCKFIAYFQNAFS